MMMMIIVAVILLLGSDDHDDNGRCVDFQDDGDDDDWYNGHSVFCCGGETKLTLATLRPAHIIERNFFWTIFHIHFLNNFIIYILNN